MRRNTTHALTQSETMKAAFAAVAIVAAIVFVVFYVHGQQGHETKNLNLPTGSAMKLNAMKGMQGTAGGIDIGQGVAKPVDSGGSNAAGGAN